METSKLAWESSIDVISTEYIYDKTSEKYICLICGEVFPRGPVDADMAIKTHISKTHGFDF